MGSIIIVIRRILSFCRFFRPLRLGSVGKGSKIASPRGIKGSSHIYIGTQTFIHRGSQLQAIDRIAGQEFLPNIVIGNRVYVGQNAFIACINEVTIEDLCVLSDYVYISDSSHGLDPMRGPIMQQAWESRGPVRIGFSTFVGYRAAIMPGVTLGKHCVVGANAVVTHSFPEYSMVGGVPARLLKKFDIDQGRWVAVDPL